MWLLIVFHYQQPCGVTCSSSVIYTVMNSRGEREIGLGTMWFRNYVPKLWSPLSGQNIIKSTVFIAYLIRLQQYICVTLTFLPPAKGSPNYRELQGGFADKMTFKKKLSLPALGYSFYRVRKVDRTVKTNAIFPLHRVCLLNYTFSGIKLKVYLSK